MKQANMRSLSRRAILYLRIALPIVLLSSVTLLIFCLQEWGHDPVWAKHACRPLVQYPLAGLTIAAGGGLAIDYIERNTP